MKIKGLRRKISFVVIFPLLTGLMLTILAAFLPLFIYYPTILENYTNRMIDNQTNTVLDISTLLSSSTSMNYIQKIANALNIGSDVIGSYLFYGLAVKSSFNSTGVYENQMIFNDEHYESNYTSDNLSLWYLGNDVKNVSMISQSSQINLNRSAVFNTLFKPISELGKYIGTAYGESYLAYDSDGLFYSHPAMYQTFYDNTTCKYNKKSPFDYDPRCRPFYTQTVNAKTNDVVLTIPYTYSTSRVRGESACRGQWNYTTTQLILMYCIDFLVDDVLENSIADYANNKLTYTYVLDSMGYVMYHPDLDMYNLTFKSISDLEFPEDPTGKEAISFNDTILPLFENQRTKTTTYKRDGKEMTIAITPILMKLGYGPKLAHMGSVGVVMKKSSLESKFNTLAANCKDALYIELYVSIAILILIGLGCIFLNDTITSSIVAPIDHLLSILDRMKKDDLSMDILASYKPSPPEIACLYDVFDKLRVVLRFNKIPTDDLTLATLIYSQALHLFTSFGNEKAMEICYRELGYICYKKELWTDAAEYLHCSYELAQKSKNYSGVEIAKRKAETANAMIKGDGDKEAALRLFGEALEVFKKQTSNLDTIGCLLDVAEGLYEKGEYSGAMLEYIEPFVKSGDFVNEDILLQRYLYIKGLWFRNCVKYREACRCFASAIEDFPVYLPSIREKALYHADIIFQKSLEKEIAIDKAKPYKDIVMVVNSNLVSGPVTWGIPGFLASVLFSHDRLSLLQFHSNCELIFNLTKIPMKLFEFKKFKSDSPKTLFFDAMIEGLKQLKIYTSDTIHNFYVREKWMIVFTDSSDKGSKAQMADILEEFKNNDFQLIIVNCSGEKGVFQELCENTRMGIVFDIESDYMIPRVFKQLEAYLCPNKEVLFN